MQYKLLRAGRDKKDEFYTRLETIEREIIHYPEAFRGRHVHLNCDCPGQSNFWRYFHDHFRALGLRRLTATSYGSDVRTDYDGQTVTETVIGGDGDFRSPEVRAVTREADVVVTNPPFSLFRDFIGLMEQEGRDYLIIGNVNAVTYKQVFPLIQSGRLMIGPSVRSGGVWFQVPDHYENYADDYQLMDGAPHIRVSGVRWFTTLTPRYVQPPVPLTARYSPSVYRRYHNYDAIEVPSVKQIPADYTGVMGVPITYLDKHCPDQFELIGNEYTYPVMEGRPVCGYRPVIDEEGRPGKKTYRRLFIRRIMDLSQTGGDHDDKN